ncbi:hypothetical protein DEI82_02215 [Curtobacterium sp. MCBD17_019]|nr:hypothetical protein DEI82_02215 [Curtobacterium sp. MCBD17_019]
MGYRAAMRARAGASGSGRRSPAVLVITIVSALLVVAAAAFAGPLRFGGPRWSPTIALPTATTAPGPTAATTPTAQPGAAGHRSTLHVDLTWPLLIAGLVVLALVVVLLVRLLARRRRGRAEPGLPTGLLTDDVSDVDVPTTAAAMRTVHRGLARALDVIDQDRPASDAITAAWLGLQEAAEDAGYRRQIAETPTEFTARVLLRLELDRNAVGTLRDLYVMVRFGTTPAGPTEVQAARVALRTLQERWPGGTPTAASEQRR